MEARRVRRPPEARQPDPHLRLERRHARRDGQGDAERGHRQALRGASASTSQTVDGHEMEAFFAAFERAKRAGSGKPQLIIAKTLIGKGIPEVEGTQKAHGEGGAKFADAARKGLGLPAEPYYVCARGPRVLRRARARSSAAAIRRVDQDVRRLEGEEPGAGRASSRSRAPTRSHCPQDTAKRTPDAAALLAAVPEFPADTKIATRKAGQDVLQPLAAKVPLLIGGSADLYGSTLNYIGDLKAGNDDFNAGPPHGPQHPLRHPRARHVRDPQRHRRARHLPPERRDVPRLRRLLPRRRSASRRSATCRSSTSSRTTASASARTARRTSRSRRSPGCA